MMKTTSHPTKQILFVSSTSSKNTYSTPSNTIRSYGYIRTLPAPTISKVTTSSPAVTPSTSTVATPISVEQSRQPSSLVVLQGGVRSHYNNHVMVGRKMAGRSKIWLLSHFVDDTRTMVQCNLCPVKIKYVGNTTNVARHLEVKHPQQFLAVTKLMQPPASPPSVGGGAAGRGGGGLHTAALVLSPAGRTVEEQLQRQREDIAVKRILHQYKQERLKAETTDRSLDGLHDAHDGRMDYGNCSGGDEEMSPEEMCPSSLWSWHSPLTQGK